MSDSGGGLAGVAPRVSVLMTCHDAAATIEESVRSVIAQTYGDWELVLVDNGSADESISIVERLGDPRVVVHRLGRDMGRTAALNEGLGHCRGTYLAILDADDVSEPTRLARQVEVLDAHPGASLVATGYHDIDATGIVTRTVMLEGEGPSIGRRLTYDSPIVHSSVMGRLDTVRDVGGYPRAYDYAQDYALWLALARRGPIIGIAEPLVRIRRTTTTLTNRPAGRRAVAWDGLRLYARAQGLPGLRPVDRLRGLRTIAYFTALWVWRTLRPR